MKRKIKLRKRIRFLLSLLLVIIVSYTTITIFKNYENNNYNFFIPTFNESKDDYDRKLEELKYSTEEIKLLKQCVSIENLSYLIDNQINKTLVIKLVKEPYYIDNYLKEYITYGNDNQDKDTKDIIAIINTHSNTERYTTKEKSDISKNQLTIINKYYYVDNTYPNEDELVTIDSKYHETNTNTKIKKIAYDAFVKMYEEAPEDSKFKINSAYRSYTTEESNYNYQITENPNTDKYTAKAGHSEHQSGYSIDLSTSNAWLKENAHKYGFILRYPENKEYLTGFTYNETHYRYCGIECATYIYENNITYEEYYEYFIKFNNPKSLT